MADDSQTLPGVPLKSGTFKYFSTSGIFLAQEPSPVRPRCWIAHLPLNPLLAKPGWQPVLPGWECKAGRRKTTHTVGEEQHWNNKMEMIFCGTEAGRWSQKARLSSPLDPHLHHLNTDSHAVLAGTFPVYFSWRKLGSREYKRARQRTCPKWWLVQLSWEQGEADKEGCRGEEA